MKLLFKTILLSFCFSWTALSAAAVEYQEIYEQEGEAFRKQMQEEIQKAVPLASTGVREMYEGIDYMPVWVDKDYLTHYAELLASELKDDFDKGLYKELVAQYKKLLPDANRVFASDSLQNKVALELGIMKLYLAHIKEILQKKKSKHTALSLLQLSLKDRSLISALNAITKERIMYRTVALDKNITFIKEAEKMDITYIQKLKKGSDKERLKVMYEMLDFHPVWVSEAGLSNYTKELFIQISQDITLDKHSKTYAHYTKLNETLLPKEKEKIVALEFEIARLYQSYMSHMLYGQIDWEKFQNVLKHKRNADWVTHNVLLSPESLLIESLKYKSLAFAFKEATPVFPLYDKLMGALQKYQDIVAKGGWETLPDFKDLKPGKQASIVPVLRERLKMEGDYIPCGENNETELYDECLVEAVKIFQARHGLTAEGFVGKMTRKSLNESAESKVARIKLNLDRMKWVKRSHDRYHIWVNIPGYQMYVFDEDELIETMKVIVGRNGHNTPIFYNRVRTIVLNPFWRIPASIIRHEIIPKLKKNPNYTNKKKIEIHTGYSEHSPRVNPHKVNWYKYGRKLPPYKFMQSPGKHNALGKVKYLFPNKYSVYMHDTNQPYLFDKDIRALSHGCIRLHKPFELLEVFSKIDRKIDVGKTESILKNNKKTPIRLSNSIPVDIIYLTTWVENDDTVAFRDDIYGYDKIQLSSSSKQ